MKETNYNTLKNNKLSTFLVCLKIDHSCEKCNIDNYLKNITNSAATSEKLYTRFPKYHAKFLAFSIIFENINFQINYTKFGERDSHSFLTLVLPIK